MQQTSVALQRAKSWNTSSNNRNQQRYSRPPQDKYNSVSPSSELLCDRFVSAEIEVDDNNVIYHGNTPPMAVQEQNHR